MLYRGRELRRITGGGVSGNFVDVSTGDEYWVSGVKTRGSNTHWAESTKCRIDDDAVEEVARLRARDAV